MAKVEDGSIESFRPQRRNLNKHSQRGMGALEASMRKHGYVAPMTAAADGEIIDGSARLETVANVFEDDVLIVHHDGTRPVVMVRDDIPDATTNEARAISALANRIAEINLTWDAEELLADLQSGVDFGNVFDQEELDAMLAGLVAPEPVEDTPPDVSKADELQKKWNTSLGQMWSLGQHRLICGDCTDKATVERLMGGEKVVLIVTDPPYAVNYDPQWRVGLGGGGTQDFANGQVIKNDDSLAWMPGLVLPDADVIYAWTADKTIKDLQVYLEGNKYTLAYIIIWNKDLAVFGRGDYHWRYEPCLYMVKKGKNHNWQGDRKQETVWDIPTIHSFKNGKDSDEWGLVGHGNQKPLECMAIPIRNNSAVGEIVYDPFLGSGTTLIACQSLSRQCRAIELDAGYVAIALERWATATNQTPVLINEG